MNKRRIGIRGAGIALRRIVLDAIVALVLFMGGTGPAAAGDGDARVIGDKWLVSVGCYFADAKTNVAVGTGGVLGTFIRAENELGVDSNKSVARLDGFFRFNERHALGFGLWTLKRNGTKTIEEQIAFDDYVFDANGALASDFDTSWLRLDWRYSMLRTDRGEAGFTAGISAYKFDLALAGEGTLTSGGEVTTGQFRASDSFLAPAPTIGIFLNYAITPRLLLRFKADYISANIADIDAKLVDTSLMFEWYFARHVGVGVGSNGSSIDVTNTGDSPYIISYKQTGFVGHVSVVF